uniref:Uncharacterized protein n=1 Tax=Moschus moschiferus TaxID=68415 RepID=A0A8C6G1J1_MOSMO
AMREAIKVRLVPLSTPPHPSPEGRKRGFLTDAGSQFHQHVVAAELGEQLEQAAHRGSRTSLPVVQQPARGVGVLLQLLDLQVLEVHRLRQHGPVGRHRRPRTRTGRGARTPRRGLRRPWRATPGAAARASRVVGRRFLLPLRPPRPPGPAPPVSLSEKRRPAPQSGAPADARRRGRPVTAFEISGGRGCGDPEPAF